LRIIKWVDGVIETIADAEILPTGEIGEVVVKGENVTRAYHRLPEATARAKIRDGAEVWHRIGDLGYLDERGRVWYCGRAAHRVETGAGVLYSVCCEAIFNAHPEVKRSALIGLGDPPAQTPMLIIEPWRRLSRRERESLTVELQSLARQNPTTQTIDRFGFVKAMPVDIRHNAKINRETLRAWFSQ
jgi:acyl-CoA synthetase (AMP-forming)/AMP-acid ligase II